MNDNYFSRSRLSNYNSRQILTVLDKNGEIYEGNFSFYEVWSRLDGKLSVSGIIASIQDKFRGTDTKEIEDDVLSIIDEMLKHELIDYDNSIVPQINITDNTILVAHVAVTSYCNLSCSHCYLDKKNNGLITMKEFDSVLKDLASIGVLTIEISGGEPLMHNNFMEIIMLAKKYGFFIKLFTNATLIDETNYANIKKYIDCYRISLDGGEKIHDLRRGNGAFKKTVRALQLLNDRNVQISMTVDDTNCDDISAVKQISDQLKLKLELSPVVPYSHLQFTHDRLKNIQEKINEIFLAESCGDKRAEIRGVNCNAAERLLYINSKLDVTPCPLLYQEKWRIGNLKTNTLSELLKSERYKMVVNHLHLLKSKCLVCNKCQFWCAAIVDQAPDNVSPFCIKKK